MKKVMLAGLLLVSSTAFSMGVDMPSLQFPKQGQWAVAMVSRACDIPLKDLKAATGKITRTNKKSVLYTVYLDGQVYAQATARNTSIFAKKTCL